MGWSSNDSIIASIDRTSRDIHHFTNANRWKLPYRGKIDVLGGDFRKIILVITKETRHEVVYASINSSNLRQFCQVLTFDKKKWGSKLGIQLQMLMTWRILHIGYWVLEMDAVLKGMMGSLTFIYHMIC